MRRNQPTFVLSITLLLINSLSACAISDSEPPANESGPAPLIDGIHDLVYEEGEAARECLLGWWTDPPMPCQCPRQPECKYGDCMSYGFSRYMNTGDYISGSISVSEIGNTVTTWAYPSIGTFTSTSGHVTVTLASGTKTPVEYFCSGDRLKLGYFFNARLDPKLSASLERLAASEGYQWKESPLDL